MEAARVLAVALHCTAGTPVAGIVFSAVFFALLVVCAVGWVVTSAKVTRLRLQLAAVGESQPGDRPLPGADGGTSP